MMGDKRTRNGQIFDQLIGIGSSKPFGELGFWEFFANDRSHVEGFKLIENALKLQWRTGRRMMCWLMNLFRFAVGDCCGVLFGIAVRSRLGLGVTVRRKWFGRYRDLRIKSRIVCMRCHDLQSLERV